MVLPLPIPTDGKSVAALSKPILKLIEAVSAGIGKVYEPLGTVVQAKADGLADIIRAEADLKVKDLQQRALIRILATETDRQQNIESIVSKSKAALPESVSDVPVKKEWITHFFEAAKDVSNEEMQELWARVLAGEVAAPGQTSRRTIDALKAMDRQDAEMFSRVVFASVKFGGWFTYLGDPSVESILESAFSNAKARSVVAHLVNVGLLSSELGFLEASKTTGVKFVYAATEYVMKGPPAPGSSFTGIKLPELCVDLRNFTAVGQQLAQFVAIDPFESLVDSLSKSLTERMGVSIEQVGHLKDIYGARL
jgi:uncharacterized protein YqgV (UPF0045/DUF77 family)